MSAKTTILHENGTDDELYPVTKASVTYRNDGTTTVEGTLTDYDTLEEKFGDTSATLPTTAQTVVGAIAELDDWTDKLRTKITYHSWVDNYRYKNTTANTWEYIGKSFTVPSDHRAVVCLMQGYSSGKPIGIGVSSSATATNISIGIQATQVDRYVVILSPGTYYIYTMRATVATSENRYDVSAFDLDLSST